MTFSFGAFWSVILIILLGLAFLGFEKWPVFLWLGVGMFVYTINKEDSDA